MKRYTAQKILQASLLGLALSLSSGYFEPAHAGNPCDPKEVEKNGSGPCRDWINGNKKPPVRPKHQSTQNPHFTVRNPNQPIPTGTIQPQRQIANQLVSSVLQHQPTQSSLHPN